MQSDSTNKLHLSKDNKIIIFYFVEEILPSPNALWWSESGRFLAYALFDDSNTTKVTLPVYGNSREEFPDPRAEWKPKPYA
jgi:hypothetical protein